MELFLDASVSRLILRSAREQATAEIRRPMHDNTPTTAGFIVASASGVCRGSCYRTTPHRCPPLEYYAPSGPAMNCGLPTIRGANGEGRDKVYLPSLIIGLETFLETGKGNAVALH